jgi:hypothetical protein
MRYVIYALFFICSFPLFAQTGNYFLSHYVPNEEHFDNVCFGMAQDNHGILYFATKAGVLQFDGRNWDYINGYGAVYSLSSNSAGDIYWGGANGFGKINYGENGFIRNELLTDTLPKDIFQSLIVGNKVFFLSDQTIFVYSISAGKTIEIKSSNLTGSFTGMFELYGHMFANTERGGTFRIDGNLLAKAKIDSFENAEITFSAQYEKSYLVGTKDNRIYLCSPNLKLHQINLEDQAYISAGVIIGASWINNQLIVLGTLRGGVIFVNPQTGKTKEIVNYNTGLPDNEVFAMITDRNQNIWIAHDYGFTRVAPYLPLRSFSHYEGFHGNLLCAISFNQEVYVGTSLGLFKLEKEDVYDEIIYYENVKVEEKKKEKNKAKQDPVKQEEVKPPAPETEVEAESKKKGFLSFLRRKKKPEVVEEKQPEIKKSEEVKTEEPEEKTSFFRRKPVYKREQRIQKVLRSSQFVYKKVQGIDAKVTQLLEIKGKLIAAGLGGAFEVHALQSKPLLEEPVRFIFANKDLLLTATYNDEVRSWSLKEKTWSQTTLFENLDDEITFIFEGAENEIWFCALDKIYRVEVTPGEVKNIQALEISNADLNESVGIHYQGKTIVANAEGFFGYNATKRELIKIDTLPKPGVYFADSESLWYRDAHGWNSFGSFGKEGNLQLLNLFQDLRFITTDQYKGNLWLITGNNELFKFFSEKLKPYEAGYPLLVKSIKNGNQTISTQGKIRITEKSAFSVEVVQPDYISSQSMEYRFFLKGLHKTWSDWDNNNNVVDFSYLPPGKYTLEIQAKDIFGKVNEIEPLQLVVQPPYWQRPWFYALEFGLFASLVVISFRLSSRYIIISRILSLITIILLIQFIQTVASVTFATQTSPVIDFFIQVGVALLILPVEGYLRKLMLRSIDENYKLMPQKKEEPLKKEESLEGK